MASKLKTALYLATCLLIALGAIGHSLGSWSNVQQTLVQSHVPPETITLIMVVWHFAGGCMVTFGALGVQQWWGNRQWRTGNTRPMQTVGFFYLIFGLLAVWASNSMFFLVFVALGGLLMAVEHVVHPLSTGKP